MVDEYPHQGLGNSRGSLQKICSNFPLLCPCVSCDTEDFRCSRKRRCTVGADQRLDPEESTRRDESNSESVRMNACSQHLHLLFSYVSNESGKNCFRGSGVRVKFETQLCICMFVVPHCLVHHLSNTTNTPGCKQLSFRISFLFSRYTATNETLKRRTITTSKLFQQSPPKSCSSTGAAASPVHGHARTSAV